MDWLDAAFESPEFGALAIPAALLVGATLAIGSSCNWPAVAVMAGYAGSRGGAKRSHTLAAALSFTAGTIASLMALGVVMGAIGRWGDTSSLRAGKLAGGFLAIFLGLASMNLLPFRLPSFRLPSLKGSGGLLGAIGLGFVVGALSMASTGACCGSLPIIMGMALLKTRVLFGSAMLIMFAIGYSLPALGVMMGANYGSLSALARRLAGPIQKVSGAMMVLAGFWLLISL